MAPTLGGVHKIQISIRDLLKEFFHKFSAKKWGGSGGPRPPYCFSMFFLLGFSDVVSPMCFPSCLAGKTNFFAPTQSRAKVNGSRRKKYKGVGVVATPHAVLPRDSH